MRLYIVLGILFCLSATITAQRTNNGCNTSYDSIAQLEIYYNPDSIIPSVNVNFAQDSIFGEMISQVHSSRAYQVGLRGTVYVSFVVDKTGNVLGTKILRGLHEEIDQIILRAFQNLPAPKSGYCGGQRVAVRLTVPVNVD